MILARVILNSFTDCVVNHTYREVIKFFCAHNLAKWGLLICVEGKENKIYPHHDFLPGPQDRNDSSSCLL